MQARSKASVVAENLRVPYSLVCCMVVVLAAIVPGSSGRCVHCPDPEIATGESGRVPGTEQARPSALGSASAKNSDSGEEDA